MDAISDLVVRAIEDRDREWIAEFIAQQWGADAVITISGIYLASQLPGFIAIERGQPIGLITFLIDGEACEIVTLDSLHPRRGIGTVLVNQVAQVARRANCERLWLITTNDNLEAIGFYQRRGFSLVAVHANRVDNWRLLKPQIPLVGMNEIPLHDALEFEMTL